MSVNAIIICIVLAATSLGAYLAGTRIRHLTPTALLQALHTLVQCAGAVAVFLALNMLLGFLLILFIRSMFVFVSFYALLNAVLLLASAFQGLLFQLWSYRSRTRL